MWPPYSFLTLNMHEYVQGIHVNMSTKFTIRACMLYIPCDGTVQFYNLPWYMFMSYNVMLFFMQHAMHLYMRCVHIYICYMQTYIYMQTLECKERVTHLSVGKPHIPIAMMRAMKTSTSFRVSGCVDASSIHVLLPWDGLPSALSPSLGTAPEIWWSP